MSYLNSPWKILSLLSHHRPRSHDGEYRMLLRVGSEHSRVRNKRRLQTVRPYQCPSPDCYPAFIDSVSMSQS